jgi:hypothetical protein
MVKLNAAPVPVIIAWKEPDDFGIVYPDDHLFDKTLEG